MSKGKGVGKGQSNRGANRQKSPSEEAENNCAAGDEGKKLDGAVVAGPSSHWRRSDHHNMEDIAWKTVDTDEEILERGNGKWVNLRITEHQRTSSEDDDDSNGRFLYFGTAAHCVESLNKSGQGGEDKDVSEDEERDIIYDKKEFTVRAVSKKKPEAESSETSSSPTKANRKGKRKRKNSHNKHNNKDKANSSSKAADKPRRSRGDRKSDPPRNSSNAKKAGKDQAQLPPPPDSASESDSSPTYEPAPLIKPPSTRRLVVELSSDSEGECGGDRVHLFNRSPRPSRIDSPRTRGSRYGPAGKPLNAANEEIDSSPESYRNKAEVAWSLSTSGKTKLYLAKRPDRNSEKNTWISVRCQ